MTQVARQTVEAPRLQRRRIEVCGAVQGVGFRPFVYRLARELGVVGWVNNSPQGVDIEAQGEEKILEQFVDRLEEEAPPMSSIQSCESVMLDPTSYCEFEIRPNSGSGSKSVLVLPDIATCVDCRRETFDPADRRYCYPFTNCTNCGPRYSIIEALPYDRANTTMQRFMMCKRCSDEYEDPSNRRFHAQPNACPSCGPQLELWDARGSVRSTRQEALLDTARAIREGAIAAIKGLGGFHLLVDARNQDAVQRLRHRKGREEKPFALMFPTVDGVGRACELTPVELKLLDSPESPIVLLPRRGAACGPAIAPAVAPGNPYLGVMLPYTPLHHLLMHELGFPIVATSGNRTDEPICIDEREAVQRLHGIADIFLIHDRPIVHHVDDSVVRVMAGRKCVFRRARGYAPFPVRLEAARSCVLAVGAHLKNTVALSVGHNVYLSQHIGDLDTGSAVDAFKRTTRSLQKLYDAAPEIVACDMHPDYISTQWAAASGGRTEAVQHHHAHIVSCMAEHSLTGTVLGVAWDGTGYGPDGTIWGGEILIATQSDFRRFARLRSFRLPGGETAIREPRRAAIGLLYEAFGDDAFALQDLVPLQGWTKRELGVLRRMLNRGLNAPVTSSAGRLFDAVAALLGIAQIVSYEGQAAVQLEFALGGLSVEQSYAYAITDQHDGSVMDWEPMVRQILADLANGVSVGHISAMFHNTLVDMVLSVAYKAGLERTVLSGGCFQNCYLLERAVDALRSNGLEVYFHQLVPPNDGGIALGQAAVASARADKEQQSCA